MTIQEMLDQLADLQAKRDYIQLERQACIDAFLTPEILAQVQDVNTHFDQKAKDTLEAIDKLTAEVKQAVLAQGATAKGTFLMAVWNKGKTTWDGDLLKGFSIAHPEILACQKIGQPTVTIRTK